MDQELQILHRNLSIVKKALDNVNQLNQVTLNFIRSSQIRDLYRGLRGRNVHNTATQVVVHTENIVSELNALERTLRDAEAILLHQAEHYDKDTKATR
jgi:hypothetical protein